MNKQTIFRRLQELDGERYQSMTFPVYRAFLEGDGHAFAVGAESEGQPVGMALGYRLEDQAAASLLSLFVTPDARRAGLGQELLRHLEEAARAEGCASMRATYMTGKPGIAAFERVLAKGGWNPPQARMLVVKSTIPLIRKAPWMKLAELPARMAIVPWNEVTEGERAGLRRSQETEAWIPEDLVPFDHEENFEPWTSLALRHEDRLVGWVINHQMSAKLIRFTCSFMRPDFQRLGRIVWLYAESVRRMEQHGFDEGMWTVPFKYPRNVAFTRRWMAPYASFFGETRGAEKPLC